MDEASFAEPDHTRLPGRPVPKAGRCCGAPHHKPWTHLHPHWTTLGAIPPSRPPDGPSRAHWRVPAPRWQWPLDTGSTPCSLQGCSGDTGVATAQVTMQVTMLTGTLSIAAPFTPHSHLLTQSLGFKGSIRMQPDFHAEVKE